MPSLRFIDTVITETTSTSSFEDAERSAGFECWLQIFAGYDNGSKITFWWKKVKRYGLTDRPIDRRTRLKTQIFDLENLIFKVKSGNKKRIDPKH